MAGKPNIGYATLSVIPSVKGFQKELEKQLGSPFEKAAAEAGRDGSTAMRKAFEKVELVDPDKAFDGVEPAAKRAGSDAADALASNRGEFAAAGKRLSDATGDGLDFSGAASGAAGEIVDQLDGERGNVGAASRRLGVEAVDGFGQGLDSGSGGVGDRLSGILGDDGAGLDIGRGIGEDVGTGVSGGLLSSGGDVVGSFTGALEGLPIPALAAGAAAGALLAKGFVDALDFSGATAKLRAQLGATKAEAEALGDISLDIFAGNYGEDIDQVNDAIRRVRQNSDAFSVETEQGLQDVATQALSTANVFDEDLNGVIRAASQLLRTGLATDSTQAFDLITKGLQGPVNKADDLLDTFNEYSTQFRKLGIDGPTALGLLSQAVQAGARDSDIAADAFKEFSVRAADGSKTTADGFELVGLNAEVMGAKIAAGGSSATAGLQETLDAVQAIEDPVQRNIAGVALFGTQFEDLGAAFDAFDTRTAVAEFGKVEGAAAEATEAFGDSPVAALTTLKRELDREMQGFWEDILAAPVAFATGDFETIGADIMSAIGRGLNLIPFSGIVTDQINFIRGLFDEDPIEVPPMDTERWEATWPGIIVGAKGAEGGLSELSAATKVQSETAEQAEKRNDAFADTLSKLGDKAALARTDLAGLEAASSAFSQSIEDSTQIDDLLDSTLSLRSAQQGLGQELGNLPKAFTDTDLALQDMTDTQAGALDQLGRLGDGIKGYLSTLIASGASTEDVQAKSGRLRDQYFDIFKQLGVTTETMQQYQEILGLTEEQVNTAITLSGDAEAIQKLQILQSYLTGDAIPADLQLKIGALIANDDFAGAAELASAFVRDAQDGIFDDPLVIGASTTLADELLARWVAGVEASAPALQPVGVDTAPADGSVDDFLASLFNRPPTDVAVGANTAPGEAQVNRFRLDEQSRTSTLGFGADLTQAEKDIAGFFARNRTLLGLGVKLDGARADGGPVSSGNTYLVGENGPELFTSKRNGQILNQQQLAQGFAGANGATGPQATWNIYETTSARDTAETVGRFLRRSDR